MATRTWNGGGTNNSWTNASNWGGTAPVAGDDLVFAGTVRLTSCNNNFTAGTIFNSITFDSTAGEFSITGNQIELTNGITNNSSNLEIMATQFVLPAGAHTIDAASGDIRLTAAISSTGDLTKTGSYTLQLSTTNTYTGTTTISAGTLQLGIGSTGGALSTSSAIVNNSVLAFSRSNTSTQGTNFSHGISGTGSIEQRGTSASVLQLSGTNTYTGKTKIVSGTLRLGSGWTNAGVSGPLGAPTGTDAVIDIHNGAFFTTVAIAGATTHTTDRSFDMVSNGAGTVSIGTTSNDAGFAFGGVLASGTGAKTLQLRCGLNTGGDRHWMVINGAIVDPSGAATSVDVIFDTQGTGDSKLHLAAVNTFTGPMTMTQVDGTTAGTVFVGSTATGSSGAPINGSGQLQSGNYGNTISVGTLTALSFNSSADQIVGGIISGAGLLKKVGTGKLTLSAANTCTGATTITGGTLQLGNAGVTGSLATSSAITITSPGILAINRANTFLFGTDCVSVVSGTGGLTQAGSGTTIITSTQTYTGATTINAGTVKVTGTINASSAITVKSGGSLTGTGTVGAITMESGGSIGPSATATVPGTLTTGNVTFVAGSNYKVRLDGVAPSFDKINSSGTVNLASATLTIAAITNPLVGGIYTIVGAVTRSNEFTGLAEGASITAYGSTFTVNYTGTTVTLTCTVAYTAERFLPFFLP